VTTPILLGGARGPAGSPGEPGQNGTGVVPVPRVTTLTSDTEVVVFEMPAAGSLSTYRYFGSSVAADLSAAVQWDALVTVARGVGAVLVTSDIQQRAVVGGAASWVLEANDAGTTDSFQVTFTGPDGVEVNTDLSYMLRVSE
jgi:hypothetical protein